MKQLVIFPKGALTPKDKERLSKEGYLAIEADEPSKVILPSPFTALSGNAVLLCAMEAMTGAQFVQAEFATRFTAALKKATTEAGA